MFIGLYAIPIPIPINETYSAVRWYPDKSTGERCYVNIRGVKKVYLLRVNSPLILSGAAFTTWTENEIRPIRYVVKDESIICVPHLNAPIIRTKLDGYNNSTNSHLNGIIYRDYDCLTRGLMIISGKNMDDYIVGFPAETLENAKSVTKDFLQLY
jgi:hypothetical protein